ncbi:ras guanyl-releasing protein 3-like [Acanthaster planci]|uniref:Ras guanyl-releasing protein 3-like n=1 Tax=Acanthaster planci TaxID=133434 RepID=A0A8B7Z1K9_ACAPL|nr:ras guanyl-releasing protein 3-like [Acanthaster planci]XP_022097291.1 ras guanyl-releasing protein 3-like [Acanthaster planci]XP_022097292.1 ras guanyl-releasing protein 3-like [Acanthaster planci]
MNQEASSPRRRKLGSSSEPPDDDRVSVKSVPMDRLAELTVECFDEDGMLIEDSTFPKVVFQMHKWFTTSKELAGQFLNLYKQCSTSLCATPVCTHKPDVANCLMNNYKKRICHALRYWIVHFPMHFDLDQGLSDIMGQLQSIIQAEGNSHLKHVIDTSNVPSYDWMRVISVRNPSMRTNRKVSLVFNHLEPRELANHLTFLEYKIFRRLNFADLKSYALTGQLKDNLKLERSIGLFNGLSLWIQCMILSRHTPKQRAEVITKFVEVAKRLKRLNNFNTLMAVVGGLSHSSLARLKQTLAYVSSDTQKTISEMTELLSSACNFSNYRKALQEARGFKIPILGVHLKDLILLHTALPDRVDPDGQINLRKMAQLAVIFEELMQLQNTKPPLETNMDLVNMLRASLDLQYTEDEIYELSLAREPRNSTSAPSTPTKPAVYADWASGVCVHPDQETITKHVSAMVETVFKIYDTDRDGYITRADFQGIATNFPFMESFCVLNADREGLISRSEMCSYFMRAHSLALSYSYKHNFSVHTYLTPTFCQHCTGLLWGLIKQGVKCKVCGINAHKHCKDRLVIECRSKKASGNGLNGITSTMQRRHTLDGPINAAKSGGQANGAVVNRRKHSHDKGHSQSTSQLNRVSISKDVVWEDQQRLSQCQKQMRLVQQATQTEEAKVAAVAAAAAASAASSPETASQDSDKDSEDHGGIICSGRRLSELSEDDSNSSSFGDQNSVTGSDSSVFKGSPAAKHEELKDRLMTAEREREVLVAENSRLKHEVTSIREKNKMLESHLELIRRHTVTFILDQMDTLHLQKDTQV